MTAQEAYLLYLAGLRNLMRRAAGASVEDAFRQLETAWAKMSPTDRLLVISKGGDIDSLLGGEPPEPELEYDWHDSDWRRAVERSEERRQRMCRGGKSRSPGPPDDESPWRENVKRELEGD